MSDVELLPVESSTLMDSYGHVGDILNSLRQQKLANNMMQIQNQYLPAHLQSANRSQELQNQQQLTTNEFLPEKLRNAARQQQLQNIYDSTRNRYAEDYFKNRNSLTSAQANALRQKVDDPLSQIHGGPYAQIHALRVLTEKYGPDDPQVKMLRRALLGQMDERDARTKFLGSNVQLKNLTGAQKDAVIASQGLPDLKMTPGDDNDPNSLKNASLGELAKKTNTTRMLNQRQFAKTAGILYNQGNDFIKSVAKYADYKGHAKLLFDRLKAGALGENNPDYLNLLKFDQVMKTLANDLRGQLGSNASNEERKTLESIVSPTLYDKSPAQIVELWKNLGNLLNKTSAGLKGNAGTLEKGLGKEATIIGESDAPQSPNQNNYSDEDINFTAKLYKMTPAQVRKKLEQMNAR